MIPRGRGLACRVGRLVSGVVLALTAAPALSHEFWIDPQAYAVPEGAPLVADIRVGETLEGAAYSYIPPNFRRFEVVLGEDVTPVEGRAGDRPALNMAVPGEGLAVIVHVTRDYTLTYREAEKFLNFITHKDFPGVLEQHAARGLPETGFVERYSRHAKSLIAVGGGAGSDREVGLLTEIVALANPFTDDLSAGLPVRVLYEGAPRADVQVELFARAPDGTVEVTLHRTDAEGRAVLPVTAGHSYLADAVVMRPVDPMGADNAVWESLWASLTFAVPE